MLALRRKQPRTQEDYGAAIEELRGKLAEAERERARAFGALEAGALEDDPTRGKLRRDLRSAEDDLSDVRNAIALLERRRDAAIADERAQATAARWKNAEVLLEQRTQWMAKVQDAADALVAALLEVHRLEIQVCNVAPRMPQYMPTGAWGVDTSESIRLYLCGKSDGSFATRTSFSPHELRQRASLTETAREMGQMILAGKDRG